MLQKCYEYDPFNVSRTKQPLCNFQNSTGCKDPSQTKLASIGALTEQQQAQRSSQFPMNSCHLWAQPSEHSKDDPSAKGETRNCTGQDETVDPELRWRFTVWGLSHSFAQASNAQIAFGMVEKVHWKNGNTAEFICTNTLSRASACCQVENHLSNLSMCFCFCYQSFAEDSFSCGKHERGYRLEVTSTNPRRDYFHGRFQNVLLTSIAVVPIQNHTVVSLGTAEGRVIQVRHLF